VAAGDLQYKQRNRDLAQELLSNTKLQIAAGAIPAIDQVRAQSNLAMQEHALALAQNFAMPARDRPQGRAELARPPGPGTGTRAHIVTLDPLRAPAWPRGCRSARPASQTHAVP